MLPPMAMPPTTSPQASGLAGGCEPSVVRTAIAMPIMPSRLPRRLESGLDRPRSARMNRTPATRESSATRVGLLSSLRHARPWTGHPRLCSVWVKPAQDDDIFRTRFMSSSLLFLLVHRKHALGDQEAAEDVHRCENERDETEPARPQRTVVVGGQRDPDRKEC